jgi:hypothetical protein
MKILICIGIACVGLLIAISIWLVWLNRASETMWAKVIPAIAGLIVTLSTIYFTTKSESIDTQLFNYTLYINKADKKLLDEHYSKQHAYGGAQFDVTLRNFIDKKLSEMGLDKIDFEKNGEKVKDFYFDLAFIRLFSRFFWLYADSWDININSVRQGDSFTSSLTLNKPAPPCISLKWEGLLETLDPNDSLSRLLVDFSQKFWIKEMKVPPKTKVGIETSTYKKTLSTKNPFAQISITFYQRGGSVGLGDYQWLLGYDNKKNNEFWSEHFEVACEAKFERLRSGHPDMPRYKRWVKTMFAEIQDQLDDEQRLKRAREYHELLAISSNSRP